MTFIYIFMLVLLTHWGRVTHICGSKRTIIGSDNGLSPSWRHIYVNQLIFSFMLFSCWIETGNWRCCKIGFPSETHLRLQFREISFVYYLLFSWQITLKFCTERHSITAVLCVFYKYIIYFGQNFQSHATPSRQLREDIWAWDQTRDMQGAWPLCVLWNILDTLNPRGEISSGKASAYSIILSTKLYIFILNTGILETGSI